MSSAAEPHDNHELAEPASKFQLTKLYLPLLCLLCAAHAWNPLQREDDVWAHAAVGRWIWENRAVPHETLFLWSAKQVWVAHSWLSQLTFYGLMHSAGEENGPLLSLLFTIVMVSLAFALIWRAWARWGRVTSLMPFVFYLAIRCSAARYQARPELFTAVFFVILAVFLIQWELVEKRVTPAKMAGILVVFWIWPNFHGAVVTGLLLLALTVIGELAQQRFAPPARKLLVLALLCAAVACLNPFGLSYWKAILQTQSMTFTVPTEWRPIWRQPSLEPDILVTVFLLAVLALASWFLNPQRRWAHLLWLLALGYLFATARRNIWMFSLTSLLVMAANAQVLDTIKWWREWQKQRSLENQEPTGAPPQNKAHLATVGCLLLWGALQITAILPLKTVSANLPVQKCNFITENKIPGRLFNDIIDSPYMEWQLTPRQPLFIDIIQAYPDNLTFNFIETMRGSPEGVELLDKNGIGFISLSSPRAGEPAAPLISYLSQSPQWALVYSYTDGTVWVRRTKEYEYLWRRSVR
jgi:hypothetical protein